VSAPAAARPRVVIVDDEPLARRRLAHLLAKDGGCELVAECGDASSALLAIERSAPDLLFLDVQMPEVDGLELVPLIPAHLVPHIVFVTAHEQFALEAFELEAVDYLLKPYTDARFFRALQRARSRIADGSGRERVAGLVPELERLHPERMLIRDGERVRVIRVAEIDHIAAEDYYACVHTGPASYLVRRSLKQLEATLDPRRFVRVHRSHLVNLERIEELRPLGGGEYELVLRGGTCLPVGPSYARGLVAALAG
jgi:two-component system LytT family response regulator